MKDVQKHDDFRCLIDQFVAELEQIVARPLRSLSSWINADIFVASPGMVTPYHIDHDVNFLLQVHGEKTVNLFDPGDREILAEEDIEQYYIGNHNAAKFREGAQSKAKVFALRPGIGVHQPTLAPHWVRVGGEYSVSIAILFFLHDLDRRAKVYQFNHYLRRIGVRPTPPGQSIVRDCIKQLILSDLGHPKYKQQALRFALEKYKAPLSVAKAGLKRLAKSGLKRLRAR